MLVIQEMKKKKNSWITFFSSDISLFTMASLQSNLGYQDYTFHWPKHFNIESLNTADNNNML